MIHQYKQNGYNIVIDTQSGSVHSVDSVAYDIIAMYEKCSREEIVQRIIQKYDDIKKEDVFSCLNDIDRLKKDKLLFCSDSYEDKAEKLKNQDNVIKALCLHVAHTCNLNCTYCFASQGKYHGKEALMSFETGKRALDFLVESSKNRRNLEVDFFGGEPLMNWDVVKKLVSYAREIEKKYNKNFRFTLTTNGVNLDDEVTEFCNREMSNVVLSLDGRKEVHDAERKDHKGNGSYEKIVPKFIDFVKKRGDLSYYVRGTYTHKNTDFTEDILHMASLGFKEISMEPVVCAPNEPYALTDEDLPKLFSQYERLAEEMIKRDREGNGFNFYHYMIDLENGPCIYKRISGCGSGSEYLAVTPTGDLYPCHQFVGDESYKMGTVWDGVTNSKMLEKFKKCNVYSKKECENCWAKLYCSGGCAANAYHATGDINGIYSYGCELFKKRMECAIMIQVDKALR